MFTSVQPDRVARRASERSEELDDDDDAISLDSTAPSVHSEDHDFNVEQVLAEDVTAVGGQIHLILWENYPLSRATWEPSENLSEELLRNWEEKKSRINAGEEENGFQLSEYYQAVLDNDAAKADRHRRRNIARKRLGEPLTEPIDPALVDPESSDEALEDNAIRDKIHVKASQPQNRPPPRQRVFKTPIVPSSEESAASTLGPVGTGIPSGKSAISERAGVKHHSNSGKSKAAGPPESTPPASPPKATKPSTSRSEVPSTTGYQGTARKPGANSALGQGVPPLSKQAPTSRNSSLPIPRAETNKAGAAPRDAPAGNITRPLTARKTGTTYSQTKPASTNAFVSGKARKAKGTLGDVMSDPTKDQRLFKSHRLTWMAEKRGREKADRAPEAHTIPEKLFSIRDGPRAGPKNQSSGRPGVGSDVGAVNPTTETLGQTRPGKENRPVKRKSVRFIVDDEDDDADREEPLDMDLSAAAPQPHPAETDVGRSISVPDHRRLPGTPSGPAAGQLRKVSLADYQSFRNITQPVTKTVVFGAGHCGRIELTFDGLPRDCQQPWFAAFKDPSILDFGHLCFSESFISQLESFRQDTLCYGTLSSPENETALEAAGDYLRSKSSGLLYVAGNLNILIYPTRCEEWRLDKFGVEPSSPSGAELKYLMFSSFIDCGLFLRRGTARVSTVSPASAREDMMANFFGLGPDVYAEAIWPHLPSQPGSEHFFYLAFPPAVQDSQRQVGLWLKTHNPTCEVYTTDKPGSWAAFLERTLGSETPATVLIHESAVWTIRRFPGLFKLISGAAGCSFRYWSQSVQSPPMFPSAGLGWGEDEPTKVEIGHTMLVPLFPHGTAILLTPSFLLSEPMRALELLEWFIRHRRTRVNLRLVTAWNIVLHLDLLAQEKYRERTELLAQQRDVPQVIQEAAFNLQGITQKDCINRFKVFQAVSELLDYRQTQDRWSIHQESNPIIYADKVIDGNDEQSLVNWFGWWSNLRLDQYREFHVVGSSITTRKPGADRMRRVIKIPSYANGTSPDPDAAYGQSAEERPGEVAGVQDASTKNEARLSLPRLRMADDELARLHLPWAFRSELLKDDNPVTLSSFLKSIGARWVWRCNGYPVLWKDGDEAYQFQVLDMAKYSLSGWFNYTWPFGKLARFSSIYSTYIGFFYTVMDGWDKSRATPGQKPRRQPWLAVYRAVNPHKEPPFTKVEVIIWDPAAPKKFADISNPREEDLLPAQQAAIRMVREKTGDKNPGTTLERVWLGGFRQPSSTYKTHFDITLDFLRCMVDNLKEYLPAAEHILLGDFRRVQMIGERNRGETPTRNSTEGVATLQDRGLVDPKDVDEDMPDTPAAGGTNKIIFHPPRRRPQQSTVTKCRNHLYEETQLARARDKTARDMEYEFQPTMEWYEVQRAEGRGFEHINVDTWEGVFNHFKIGTAS